MIGYVRNLFKKKIFFIQFFFICCHVKQLRDLRLLFLWSVAKIILLNSLQNSFLSCQNSIYFFLIHCWWVCYSFWQKNVTFLHNKKIQRKCWCKNVKNFIAINFKIWCLTNLHFEIHNSNSNWITQLGKI
jgi:hypothetical protein